MNINLTKNELVQILAQQYVFTENLPKDTEVIKKLPPEQKHLVSAFKKLYQALYKESCQKLGIKKVNEILRAAKELMKG